MREPAAGDQPLGTRGVRGSRRGLAFTWLFSVSRTRESATIARPTPRPARGARMPGNMPVIAPRSPFFRANMATSFRIAAIPATVAGKGVFRRPARVLDAAAKLPLQFTAHRMGQLRLLRPARPDDAGRLEGAAAGHSTRSTSAPSAGPPRCPTTSRCGARCSSSAASSTSTSTCARCACSKACPARSRAESRATSTSSSCARTPRASTPSLGGVMYEGTEREIVIQESVFSRIGTDRVLKLRIRAGASSRAQGT